MIESNEFMARRREAAVWCRTRLATRRDPASVLRSPELKPVDFMMDGARLSGTTDEEIDATRLRIVDALALKRREMLSSGPSDELTGLPNGRVLAFDVDASFFDGVAAGETGGLFDAEDLPPWDTWLAYQRAPGIERNVLLSWVPQSLVPVVERAIGAHMCNAYQWIELSVGA